MSIYFSYFLNFLFFWIFIFYLEFEPLRTIIFLFLFYFFQKKKNYIYNVLLSSLMKASQFHPRSKGYSLGIYSIGQIPRNTCTPTHPNENRIETYENKFKPYATQHRWVTSSINSPISVFSCHYCCQLLLKIWVCK